METFFTYPLRIKELTKMKFDFELQVSELAYITGNLHKPDIFYKKNINI